MKFSVLGSGSEGNSVLIDAGSTKLLIDAGLSAQQLRFRLNALGVQVEDISAILITHEHLDHAGALETWTKKLNTPIYANYATASAILPRLTPKKRDWNIFKSTDGSFDVGGHLGVLPFRVPHDAAEPVGFRITDGTDTLTLATDFGFADERAMEAIAGAQTVILESNYDIDMLEASDRPQSLKDRLRARHGHLSNREMAKCLSVADLSDLRNLVLYHLSRECNTPEIAREAALKVAKADVKVLCADQKVATPLLDVRNL